jgi:hypothetical protein
MEITNGKEEASETPLGTPIACHPALSAARRRDALGCFLAEGALLERMTGQGVPKGVSDCSMERIIAIVPESLTNSQVRIGQVLSIIYPIYLFLSHIIGVTT